MNYAVVIAYHPMVRRAWGKPTKTRIMYRVFETMAEASSLARDCHRDRHTTVRVQRTECAVTPPTRPKRQRVYEGVWPNGRRRIVVIGEVENWVELRRGERL